MVLDDIEEAIQQVVGEFEEIFGETDVEGWGRYFAQLPQEGWYKALTDAQYVHAVGPYRIFLDERYFAVDRELPIVPDTPLSKKVHLPRISIAKGDANQCMNELYRSLLQRTQPSAHIREPEEDIPF